MSARTIEGQVWVYLTPHASIGPSELKGGDDQVILAGLSFSTLDMTPRWTRIGTAKVSIELVNTDDIVNGRVEALRQEQRRVKADAEMKATEIEQQIQNLLAISYDGSAS